MTDRLYDNGDLLINQISSATKIIQLLKSNALIQQQLQNSMDALEKNNATLDHLSKYDALTGIFNRLGFFDAGEKILQQHKNAKTDTIVAYVDMNKLKQVNDKYGHSEGDYAIRIIGEILKDIIVDKGVAGRIGGDEFVLILPQEGYDIVTEIYSRFQRFNETSSKPYNITVSVGTCIISAESPTTLTNALAEADKILYNNKKLRPDKVDK